MSNGNEWALTVQESPELRRQTESSSRLWPGQIAARVETLRDSWNH